MNATMNKGMKRMKWMKRMEATGRGWIRIKALNIFNHENPQFNVLTGCFQIPFDIRPCSTVFVWSASPFHSYPGV